LPRPTRPDLLDSNSAGDASDEDPTESERRHQPELSRVQPVEKKPPVENEFEIDVERDEDEDAAARNRRMTRMMQGVARQVSLDPNDGMEL
jgi:type IV secretion system protein VirD4